MPAETVDLIESALDQTAVIIAAIDASQAGRETPCPAWNVAALVRHVIGQDLRNFIAVAQGEMADWQLPADQIGTDWAAEFADRADQLLAAWRSAHLDELVEMPGGTQAPLGSRADQQVAELAMHSWDLAKATEQRADLDPVLAEHALTWSRKMLRPELRGPDKAFGFEVPVPPDAPAYDRLAGWFGRDPGWAAARQGHKDI